MSEVIELGRFTVSDHNLERFLAKREAMVAAALEHLPGLRRIELAKLDDGTWIDVVVWSDRAASQHGLAYGPQVAAIADRLAEIDHDVVEATMTQIEWLCEQREAVARVPGRA